MILKPLQNVEDSVMRFMSHHCIKHILCRKVQARLLKN